MTGLSITYPQTDIARLVLSDALVIRPDATIREAAKALRAMNSSAALVGGPGAIVTERDLTRAWSHGLSGDEPVTEIATDHPIVVDARTPIAEAAAVMLNREIRHVIVVDGDRVGIVSLRTVMAVLLHAVHPEQWLTHLRLSVSDGAELWLG